MFIKEIKNKYKVGEPIYTKDLVKQIKGSRQNIMENLRISVKKGELKRKIQGVYYIPKVEIIYGVEVDHAPSIETIMKDRYIGNGKERIGIYGGTLLENKMRITEQLSGTITIITNREKSYRHKKYIANEEYILQKSYVKIDEMNYMAYMLLEVIRRNGILTSKKREEVKRFIKENNINRSQVDKMVKSFPKKTQNDYKMSEVWE